MSNATTETKRPEAVTYTAVRHFHMVNAGWMSLGDFADQHGQLIDTKQIRYYVDQFLRRYDPEYTRVFEFKCGTRLYPSLLFTAILALQWTPDVEGPSPVSVAYWNLQLPDLTALPEKLPISAESVAFFRSINEDARQFLFRQLATQERFAQLAAGPEVA